ncbi:MAG: hypothetical protein ACTSQ0_03020 [Candidatus Heimdallarchaeota archaeon]
MAITYRSSASNGNGSPFGISSITITKPAGTVEEDLMIANISSRYYTTWSIDEIAPMVTPSGWTLLGSDNQGYYAEGYYYHFQTYVFYKIAGSSEPANYTFTWNNSGIWDEDPVEVEGGISTFDGIDTADPIGDWGYDGNAQDAGYTSHNGPSIAMNNGNWAVHAVGLTKNWAVTPPTGTPTYTEAYDTGSQIYTTGVRSQLSYAAYTADGASGVKTSTSALVNSWIVFHIEIQQDPLPTYVPHITLSPSESISTSGNNYDTNPSNDTFTVTNSAGASASTLNWTATSNYNWITLVPDSGSDTQSGGGDLVTVSYDTQGLNEDTYYDTITVSDVNASNTPQTIGITVDVYERPDPVITLTPSGSISPSGDNVGNNPSNDTFTVSNSGLTDSTLNWTAVAYDSTDGYWLGCAAEPVVGNGSSVAGYSYIYNEVCPVPGKISKIEIYISNDSSGIFDFAIFNDNGSNSYTDEHVALALPISNGLNQYYDGVDFNKDDLPIEVNQYIGAYISSSGIWTKITSNGPGYRYDNGDQISGTPAASNFTTSPNSTHEFQIRVWVEYPTDVDSFITLSPSSGSESASGSGDLVTVSYDTQGLDKGLFNNIIIVSDSNALNTPQTIDVNLTVHGSGNEDYIRYNAGTQETTNHIWTDIANAWDDDFYTNAEGDIYISGVTRTLVGTVHDNVRNNGNITKVEIGLYGSHLNSDSPNSFYARFDGSTDSASYYSGVTNTNCYHWYDVTSDANGPGVDEWTWTDIDNLDVYYIGGFDEPSPDEHYITQFYIRVAYNFAADESDKIEKINSVINFSRVNDVLISSLSKVNGVTV